MEKHTWRFIDSPPGGGAFNMAFDEAVLENMDIEYGEPVLRFYTWQIPTLSLGYRQKFSTAQWLAVNPENKIDLVRRPTGGGAVLHDKELTYSVVISKNMPFIGRAPHDAYRRINEAITTAFLSIGININKILKQENQKKQADNFLCFNDSSFSDISVNGQKLVGAAQIRKRSSILQHGSILLQSPEVTSNSTLLTNQCTTITNVLGYTPSLPVIKQALLSGFASVFNCRFLPSCLTHDESQLLELLIKQKHQNPKWLFR